MLPVVTPAATRFEAELVGPFPPPTDALVQQAVALLSQHFFSAAFRARVLQAPMKLTQGLSPAEVYERLTQPTRGDAIVMRLAVYATYAGGGEVGVTTTGADGRWLTSTYSQYIITNGAKCYAAHLAHEYCHWAGFTHPRFGWPGNRKQLSVPYVVGNLMAELLGASCP